MSSFYGSFSNKGEDLKNGGTINGDLNITGKINGHTIEADVPKDAKFTDTVYDDSEIKRRVADNASALDTVRSVQDQTIKAEDSSTPCSYSAGDYFVYDGKLYKASADFSSVTLTADNISTYAEAQTQTAINALNQTITDLSNKVTALQNKSEKYYGMIIHQNIASPNSGKVEYIGINKDYTPFTMNLSNGTWNSGSWGEMPTLTRNRPAMIKTDGTFDYWLDENDYSKKADGQASDVSNTAYDGNAFAWFEPLWIRIKVSGNDLEVRFAYEQLDDDYVEVCPEHCGLWIPMFYMNVINGKGRSIAGTSVLGGSTGNTSTDAQWASIKANGANYLFLGGKVQDAISLLKVLWSKSTNSEFWGYGNMNGSDWSDTATYGTKRNPIIGGGQFYGTSDGKSANKFMHSVVLQTQDVCVRDPYLICDKKRFKISTDYHYDVSGATYKDTGIDHGGQGYIKTFTPKDGFLLPTVVGGSTSTYYCDYTWLKTSVVAVSLRLSSCDDGANAGSFALGCSADAGTSWWGGGAALMLKQLV